MSDNSTRLHGPSDGGNFEEEWSDESVQIHLVSDVGKKREHNEDSCLLEVPADPKVRADLGVLLAVADGMGGASAGEHASNLALVSLAEKYYQGDSKSIPQSLEAALAYANEQVYKDAEENPELHGMGTTVDAAVVRGDSVYIAHVGDSRVYVHQEDQELKQITEDHSMVWEQLRAGLISEEEAKNHSMRNLITKAIGIKPDVEIDLYAVTIGKGDRIMLCSDGLCGLVDDPEIHEAMSQQKDLKKSNESLVALAMDEGGNDNITVLQFQYRAAPTEHALHEGCEKVPSIAEGGIIDRLRRRIFG